MLWEFIKVSFYIDSSRGGEGTQDKNPRLRGKHYIYRSIENPNPPPKEIEVLLTDNVDGMDTRDFLGV